MNTEEKDNELNVKENFSGLLKRYSVILLIGFSIYLSISAIILIFLTKPEKEIKVPNVVGKRFVEVYNSLIRKGLMPELKFFNAYDIDDGVILNQRPEDGSIVTEGEKIKLIISRSNMFIPVPNLIGSKLPFALNKLKNIHANDRSYALGIGVITYMPSDKAADNIVIDHNPEVGEEVTPGSKVNLLISSGKVDTDMKMPKVAGQYIDLCFDLLLSKGLKITEEIVITDKIWRSGMVESQKPGPDEDIQKDQLVILKVNYYPIQDHPISSYERVTYKTPDDEKEGLYEAYIEDSKSKRIRYSRIMKPGWKIDFVFKRKGNAKIAIIKDKKELDDITINADEY